MMSRLLLSSATALSITSLDTLGVQKAWGFRITSVKKTIMTSIDCADCFLTEKCGLIYRSTIRETVDDFAAFSGSLGMKLGPLLGKALQMYSLMTCN